LGSLFFKSGKVAEAIPAFQAALDLCLTMNDLEGQRIHLNNLLEANRYLGKRAEAIQHGEAAIQLAEKQRLDASALRKQVKLLQNGEPLCRVVMIQGEKEFELDELLPSKEGRFQFHFRRNRLSLQMAEALVRQGNQLASSGQLAEALEKYQAAMDVDPYDPDPVYQSGTCLLELGAYAQAASSFAEVERLAPGWYRCRSDRWLAEQLDQGQVSDEEFRILRGLEDGGLPAAQAKPIALEAVAKFSEFAPFYLCLGDIYRDQKNEAKALATYRDGLKLVAEPDLESRLLCATAGLLPANSTERRELIERALKLEGSLVAKAMAALIRTM
jgi:tetratricopeptide (TPR) repeat protein